MHAVDARLPLTDEASREWLNRWVSQSPVRVRRIKGARPPDMFMLDIFTEVCYNTGVKIDNVSDSKSLVAV
mgnify:CR=1 FL=1